MTVVLDRRLILVLAGLLAVISALAVGIWVGRPAAPAASPAPTMAVGAAPVAALPTVGAATSPAITPGANATLAAEPRIDLEAAAARLDQPGVVFVDVRAPDAFAAGHIKGAINVPENQIASRASELQKDQDLILYCA